MKNSDFFTENMRLSDLIDRDYKLLLLLPRFGIELGFGNLTVLEICQRYHIPTSLFVMVCNIYHHENYLPDENEISNVNVQQLISYLRLSHDYYLNNRLKSISSQLNVIAKSSQKSHGDILCRFFEEYQTEVVNHFVYEDETVFPYILGVADGKKSANFQIKVFEKNHTNIHDKLSDLKNIVIKYLPGNSNLTEKTNLLFNLFDFEDDLRKHTLIEDLILVPKVRKMESHYVKK